MTTPREPDSDTAGRGPGQGELAGLLVIDFSAVVAGPHCSRLLADLGAEVIKVEPPSGDHIRGVQPIRDRCSAYFGQFNAGKRSVVLDLRRDEGRWAAGRLVERADVVIENFRPGVMAKYGLDYDTLSARRPALVYCSISGYGQTGPWAQRPATAQAVHASSGYDLALLAQQKELAAPLVTGIYPADLMAGALAFGGILAALRARDATGVGRQVDLALLDGVLSMLPGDLMAAQFPGEYRGRTYPPYRTEDGYVMIAAINQKNFEAMAHAMGRPELIEDPRFTDTPRRWANTEALEQLVAAWTRTRTSRECERVMLEAGVPAACYRTVAEQLENEQLTQRGSFVTARDGAGEYQVTANPLHLRRPAVPGGTAGGAPQPLPVPGLGEHTRAVLTELVGAPAAARVINSGGALEG